MKTPIINKLLEATKFIHLQHCHSTQHELKVHLHNHFPQQEFNPVVLSTSQQTQGIGQRGRDWTFFPDSLAFSLTVPAQLKPLTLIPLALGVYLSQYFSQYWNINLKLKWPNDLMNDNSQKVGGIICQKMSDHTVIAGVGLNVNHHQKKHNQKDLTNMKWQPGFLSEQQPSIISETNQHELIKNISLHLYQCFTLFQPKEIINSWQKICHHNNTMVDLWEENDGQFTHTNTGLFTGVGPSGEALIKINDCDKMMKIYSATLTYSLRNRSS